MTPQDVLVRISLFQYSGFQLGVDANIV